MSKTPEQHQLGNRGESLVAQLLENKGYTIIARNYQKRFGEIDLIAERNDVLAFVEVKTRTHELFDLSELITPTKQRKIIATAKAFIAEKHYDDKTCRFDVALLQDCNADKISYISNAFTEE